MLEIGTDKIAFVILRAKEVEVKVSSWSDDGETDADDKTSDTILEDGPEDGTRQELVDFLQSLNEDEIASLIALAWIGRGTYAAEELDEAMETAKQEHSSNGRRYLMSLPLLPDYLEDALEQLGFSVEEEEGAVLRPGPIDVKID